MEGMQEEFGEIRVFDTGIREASIIGQGIGLALRGLRPIAEIQYLDYLLYAIQIMSDDISTLAYRTKGSQKCPLIIRTRGHRLEGVWHAGSPMGGIINLVRGMIVCVPRNMLKAAGLPIFKKLVVHGHWIVGGSKMSKTLGNVIDPLKMKEKIGEDALRYFLLRDMSFGEDANYTEELAISRYNGDLANNFENLLNRSISMCRKNFEGCIPPIGELGKMEHDLRNLFIKGVKSFKEKIN